MTFGSTSVECFSKGHSQMDQFGCFFRYRDVVKHDDLSLKSHHIKSALSMYTKYLQSLLEVSPYGQWSQPLRSVTAMFPSYHPNSPNHTTFPAQVVAVMLSCVPMHHGLAVQLPATTELCRWGIGVRFDLEVAIFL